jgi:hypothetical protein
LLTPLSTNTHVPAPGKAPNKETSVNGSSNKLQRLYDLISTYAQEMSISYDDAEHLCISALQKSFSK